MPLRDLPKVTFAQQVKCAGSQYPIAGTITPATNGENFVAWMNITHDGSHIDFPWIHLRGDRGGRGVTTVFNIVSRAADDWDEINVELAKEPPLGATIDAASEPSPPSTGKRAK